MDKFSRSLLTEWRKLKLPFFDETILIAVSGGADSVALAVALRDLRAAKKTNLNFVVAHFNHQLRGADSDADAKFVEQLAKDLSFKFVAESWGKLPNRRGNLEESAREARYEFLRKAAEKENAFAVLTAHTLNDQAETVLLNLIRGSGVQGLGAMRKIRELTFKSAAVDQSKNQNLKSKILLVRPLLSWAMRTETEKFAHTKKKDFRLDSMNDDEKFARVKIRKKLIPLMQELNPKIITTLAQTSFLLQQQAEFSDGNFKCLIAEELSVKDFQDLSESEACVVIRNWLKAKRGSLRRIDLNHVEAIRRLILSQKSGRKIELPGGEVVIKKAGKLIFEKL